MKVNSHLKRGVALLALLLCTAYVHLIAQKPSVTPNQTVTGTVTDSSGKGLANVTVKVKGSTTSTQTTNDGSFTIKAATANASLVFTYVGFEQQEIALNGKITVSISLLSAQKALDEVVVIGYGTQRQRNVTGAVTSFDTKSIEEKPIARIDQAMIGQMPGVQIKQQTGAPGAGFSIAIRGTGSITGGTEPLYVVDGFPLDVVSLNSAGGFTANPLNNLNPNDIESLQVLKDAAAAAIYGSRGANGVVLITTKRGKLGKPVVSFNAYTGTSKAAKKLDLLSAPEWIAQATELANYKWVNSGTGRSADQTNDQRRAILGLAAGTYNVTYMNDDRWSQPGHPGLQYVDWQDAAFRNAPFQNYEVSASGGTENVRYFVSGNFLNQTGVLYNSGYKNYSARANVEVTASKRFKIGMNLAPSYSETNSPAVEGKDAQLSKLYNMTPVVEDSAGLNTGAGKNAVYQWASSSVSPVAYLNNSINLSKITRLLFSTYGELTILNGLTAKTSINYDEANQDLKRYTSDYVAGNITNYLTSPGKSSSGSYGGYKKQNFVIENTINFNKTFAAKHNVSVVGGMSYSYSHTESFSISASSFANDIVTTLSGAIAPTGSTTVFSVSNTETNNTLYSFFGRVQYSYLSKYLLSASLRGDAASRFGANNRWATFPSLSLGWRVSDEDFMKNVKFVSDVKLRASYGKAGSSNIPDYGSVPTLASSNYSFGGSTAIGYIPGAAPNPNIQWELSDTYDGGLDANFFRGRINATFDVYRRVTTKLFLNNPTVFASGFGTSLQNIGSVVNTGIELGINTINVRFKDFQWSTTANIAFNKNKVAALGTDGAPINISTGYGGNPPFLLQIGLPLYSYYLVKTNGILSAADITDSKVAKLSGQTVGDAKYVDRDGNGIIDASDRSIVGQPNPKYTWGMTNNFRYKAFDLSVQMYGQHGGSIYSFLARAIDNPANGRNTTLGIWRDRYSATNPNLNAPRGKIGEAYTIPLFTTDWLYSSDFWRIQSVTLGYNLKSVIKTSFLNNARIYASAQNFFGHDKYAGGVNPEAANTNVSGSSSFPLPGDYGAMPLNKTVTIGINFSL